MVMTTPRRTLPTLLLLLLAERASALAMGSRPGVPVAWNVGAPTGTPVCKPFGRQSVVAALEALKQGQIIVVTDDESRENEGDLIMAAELATEHTVGFIVRYTSGVICCSVPGERLEALDFPPMCTNNEDPKGTAFTVSVDLKHGTTTGISAADRAATFRALADPKSTADDFCRPGHVFPLRPRVGGVLERDGHTEAAHDFMRLAGLQSVGILSEVCNEDGSMARIPELLPFAEEHGLVLTSIADLADYIREVEGEGQHTANGKTQPHTSSVM